MTGEEKKLQKLQAMTHAKEVQLKKALTKEYSAVLREITKEIAFYTSKMTDGKLTRTEMYKYNRYQSLSKAISDYLKDINTLNAKSLSKYVADQYELNYFYTGYIMETEYQVKLAYQQFKRETVLKAIENPIANISLESNKAAVRNAIQSAITQSIIKGEGINDAGKRVKRALEQNANNAFRIVRTETTRIMNQGELDSMAHAKDVGLPIKKQWVSTLGPTTRSSHAALDGEIKDIDEPFSNGLMYPGDPSRPPEEIINCSCTMITVIEGYENAYQYRAARGVTGNEIIPYRNFREWRQYRIF